MPSLLNKIETVRTDSLTLHPDNANEGDVEGIQESLDENLQFAPLIVQRSTGYVLSGNHTLIAARTLGWEEIDATFIDVDDARAVKIMLAANKTRDRASTNEEALLALLEGLEGDYAGTGFVVDDYEDLLAALGKTAETPFFETEASYAETDEEVAARAEKFSEYGGSMAARGIRETVIILPQEDHDELHRLLANVRTGLTNKDLTNGELVLQAVRVFSAAVQNGDPLVMRAEVVSA